MGRDITEEIKPYVKEIVADADKDQSDAIAVITAHRLHCAAPRDPGAFGICCAAFDEWKKHTGRV